MGWTSGFLQSRVSVPIVLGGTIAIVALIKLTSLLPGQHYFRFSQLVGSNASPFIVDPPGVTYARLCRMVQENRLADGKFSVALDQCPTTIPAPSHSQQKAYGKTHESEIYRAVYENDERLRKDIEARARQLRVASIPVDEIQTEVQQSSNIDAATSALSARYQRQVSDELKAGLSNPPADGLTVLARVLPAGAPADSGDGAGATPQPGLDQKAAGALLRAAAAYDAGLAAPPQELRLEPVTKAKLDEIIGVTFSREDLIEQLVSYYSGQVADHYNSRFLTALEAEGISTSRDKAALDKSIRDEGLQAYVLAALIRLAPVFLFGFFIGVFYGATEITSAAYAAALAAFVLAWPVILLWDRVVSYTWQDKRHIFIALYILYVVSFFVAARVAASLGALVHEKLPWRRPEEKADGEEGVKLSLARDFLIGVAVNVAFYVANSLYTQLV